MSDTLQDIFDEPVTPEVVETPEVTHEVTETKPDLPTELVWEEEETNPDVVPPAEDDDDDVVSPADTDEKSEEELKAIEERNKWMKHRLAPVKDKLTKAEQELEKLRQENAQLKGTSKPPEATPAPTVQAPANTINDLVERDPSVIALATEFHALEGKEGVTNGELMLAASRLNTRRELLAATIQQNIAAQTQAVQKAEKAIIDDLQKGIAEKKEVYPDIDLAYKRINNNTEHLHIDIRRALLMDDNGDKVSELAPDLIHAIGTDKEALGYLIAQSKLATNQKRTPVAALEYIGRLKANIQKPDAPSVAPDLVASAPRKPSVGFPRKVRSTPVSDPVDLNAWATKAVKEGKAPWLE